MTGMKEEDIVRLGAWVDDAALNARLIPMLIKDEGEIALEDAYQIQRASIERRKLRGDGLVGMKMGLTSKAKMEQVGVHEPIYGHLTQKMQLADGGALKRSEHCHPRTEPEIAFVLKADLEGPVTPSQALDAVDYVCCALEVIDSRYEDFKFTLSDVVADNASSSRFVLGPLHKRPDEVDLGNLGMVLEHNGEVVQTGSSSAIYDHPAASLAELANMLASLGEKLTAGQVVLAGAATAAIHVHPGDVVKLSVDQLGGCGFSVTD
jgi:2-oxo-3-hexenedioate decarboxylase